MRHSIIFYLYVFFTLILNPTISYADSALLYNQAAADAGRIDSNIPIEDKLNLYRSVFSALDRIVAEYPSSQEALRLLTGQATGSFNPSKVRNDYINELTNYNKRICDATPSFKCLGFISLDLGFNNCKKALNFFELDSAHRHIQNAAKIFYQQKEGKDIISVVLGAYRQCSEGRINITQWDRDYFKAKLVLILISLGEENVARAIIQQMETPYFKFEGALTLAHLQGQRVGIAYIERLRKFIKDKITLKEDAFLAAMRLHIFAFEYGPKDLNYISLPELRDYENIINIELFEESQQKITCDSKKAVFIYNLMLDYQVALIGFRRKRPNAEDANWENSQILSIGNYQPKIFEVCIEGQYNDMPLMISIHGLLLKDLGDKIANSFRAELERRSMSREDLVAYYLNVSKFNIRRLSIDYFDETDPPSGRSKWWPLPLSCGDGFEISDKGMSIIKNRGCGPHYIIGSFKNIESYAVMPFYKALVDAGDVCASSKLLFQYVSNTPRYSEAVNYIINSSAVDPTKVYKCGDAELELLLK